MKKRVQAFAEVLSSPWSRFTNLMLGAPCTLLSLDAILLAKLLLATGRDHSKPGVVYFISSVAVWLLSLRWLWHANRPARWHFSMRDLWAMVTLVALVCGILVAAYDASAG
jgi:hypothetical protein